MSRRINGLIPWWYWMWLVHGAFVLAMRYYYFSRKPEWVKATWSSVSLAHEMNYAVWWAGTCLLLAALIFYRVASLHRDNLREAIVWIILAGLALTLSVDEVGSLHELVSLDYGWLGLLPFALVLGAAFGYAVITLLQRPGFRLTALLVLLAVFLFAAVAGLEYVEHNVDFESKSLQRYRLIGEEAIELIGVSLLIIGGLVAMTRHGLEEKRITVLAGRIEDLWGFRELVFCVLVLHWIMTVIFCLPRADVIASNHLGNPAALYPIYLFFITAVMCLHRARTDGPRGAYVSMGLLFLIASLGQTYSFNRLFNRVFGQDFQALAGAPGSWLITLVVPLAVFAWVWWSQPARRGRVIGSGLILFVVTGLVYASDYRPMTYYLFSGTVAYACFWLLAGLPKNDGESRSKAPSAVSPST